MTERMRVSAVSCYTEKLPSVLAEIQADYYQGLILSTHVSGCINSASVVFEAPEWRYLNYGPRLLGELSRLCNAPVIL